jgi:hypothetical protein
MQPASCLTLDLLQTKMLFPILKRNLHNVVARRVLFPTKQSQIMMGLLRAKNKSALATT